MIDFDALRAAIVSAAVRAVNAELEKGADRARHDAPVRKVFKGGRQTVRFKTADEIERDKGIRVNLGLGPEQLATPALLAQVKRAGLNPIRSVTPRSSRVRGLTQEQGFARTVQHPSRSRFRSTLGATDSISGLNAAELGQFGTTAEARRHLQLHGTGTTPAQRGITRNARNRQNTYRPPSTPDDGYNTRIVESRGGKPVEPHHLKDSGAERQLSGRGRYELKSGRAFYQRQVTVKTAAIINGRGQLQGYETETVGTGPNYLGGALRGSIRVEPASSGQYPVIEGWLVAGGGEVDYAKYQELGTRHNPAHPFLRPRLPEWRQSLPGALKRSFARG